MKPFDLEAAKRGEKVITRDGREAEIAYFDMAGPHPIQGRVKVGDRWHACFWNNEGESTRHGKSDNDLFMAPVKRKLWLVVKVDGSASHIGSAHLCLQSALAYRKDGMCLIEVEIEV